MSSGPNKARFLDYSLDIRPVVGVLVYELLTSDFPFTVLESSKATVKYSAPVSDMLPNRRAELASLIQYCQDTLDFLTHTLQNLVIQDDAIAFVKSLLAENPPDRPTAINALSNQWLTRDSGHLTL